MINELAQIEFIEQIVELAKEHPDADIRFFVDNDTMCDDAPWTMHEITKVKLSYLMWLDEYIYPDESTAKDAISEKLYTGENALLSEEAYNKLVDDYFEQNKEKAISVYTTAV